MILCIVLYTIGFIIFNNFQTAPTNANSTENWVLRHLFIVFPLLIFLALVYPSTVLIYKISFTVVAFAYFSICCLKLFGFKVSNTTFWEGLPWGGFSHNHFGSWSKFTNYTPNIFIGALIFYLQSKSVLPVAHTLYLLFTLIVYLLGSNFNYIFYRWLFRFKKTFRLLIS